jgi:hypothetical protein
MGIILKRTRYIVMRDDGAIFCGLARDYKFRSIEEIGNTAIKTYLSENKAKSSFLSSWWDSKKEDFESGKYRVVKVSEVLEDGNDY